MFHIHGVTGPDEYTAVVNDNLYTNVMARFNLRAAAALGPRRRSATPNASSGSSPPTACTCPSTRTSRSTPRTTTS